MALATGTIEAYWMPGCSSCLRMKEFIQKSGRDWVAINVDERTDVRAELEARGMIPPVARLGDRWVNGVDLAAVAELIDVPYEPPVIMPAQDLVDRYNLNLDVARGIISVMTDEMFVFSLPNRERQMFDLANQVASVMRAFLQAYYDDHHTTQSYGKPPEVQTKQDLLDRLDETRRLFNAWWEEDGFDDPLDRVTQTYWGYPTLLEVLEREVWHTTQHIRQLDYVLKEFDVVPPIPLTEANLAGLPLPVGIHE
jgi:hypothetical protein